MAAGVALSGVPREEVFLVSKAWPSSFGREMLVDTVGEDSIAYTAA